MVSGKADSGGQGCCFRRHRNGPLSVRVAGNARNWRRGTNRTSGKYTQVSALYTVTSARLHQELMEISIHSVTVSRG